ncbi:MAG: hypothetical protein Q8N99_09115 [Nanoarchaeota archaeon]|nr:hypothetical protein [Nanoarchaeota archaeon]
MDNTIPFFRGHEGFKEIIADERLSRPGRAIRVYNYAGSSGNEALYVIGTDHQLFDSRTGMKVNPEDVFSREAAPDGWSVEGLELSLLSEEEIKKILDLDSK